MIKARFALATVAAVAGGCSGQAGLPRRELQPPYGASPRSVITERHRLRGRVRATQCARWTDQLAGPSPSRLTRAGETSPEWWQS